MIAAIRVDDPGKLADTVGANLQLTIEEKQELLEIFDPIDRLTRVADLLDIEIEKLNVDRTIQGRVKRQMERAQKEYYLNEKIKAIQKELGRGEKSEIDELKKKIDTAGMTKDAHEKATAELRRLEGMPPMSAESTVSRNYLDWLLAVPWKKKTKEIRDLRYARQVLENDHYGLEKIKERILEFLSVRRLGTESKGIDPVFRRGSWRRKDFARDVDCESDRTQIRAHFVGRRARRSGDSRSPAYLHRRSARSLSR